MQVCQHMDMVFYPVYSVQMAVLFLYCATYVCIQLANIVLIYSVPAVFRLEDNMVHDLPVACHDITILVCFTARGTKVGPYTSKVNFYNALYRADSCISS